MNAERKQHLDPLAAIVSDVIGELLETSDVVTPLEVLLRLEIVDAERVESWRRGGLPYLERGITSGLSRVARVLGLVAEQSVARGLTPFQGKYLRRGKGPRRRLRFSKRVDSASELAYSTHFSRRAPA